MKSQNADLLKKVQISTKITLNEDVEIFVGYEVLSRIISDLPREYSQEFEGFYNLCARSSCADIRESVARKDSLPENIIFSLLNDDYPDVIEQIIRDRDNRKLINDEQIERIISLKNKDLDSIIASNFEDFTNCSSDFILSFFIDHQDPAIRNDLANNRALPMKIKNKLKKDIDPIVAMTAKGDDCSRW